MIVMSNGYRLRHDQSSAHDFSAYLDGRYVGRYLDGSFEPAEGATPDEVAGAVAAGDERLADLSRRTSPEQRLEQRSSRRRG